MKKFSKMSFPCAGSGILLTLLCVSGIAVPARAEPERYDFPKAPVRFVSPLKPVLLEFPEKIKVRREDEIRRESIAAFLQRHNRKLNEKAHEYADLIMQVCEKFGQDPFVIAALVVTESTAKNDAVSRGGDYGLMQVRWRVHRKKIQDKYPHIVNARDMFDPRDNLMVGTEIFSTYHATAKQDVRGALMRYSAGNKRMADRVFALRSQLEKSYLERLRNS